MIITTEHIKGIVKTHIELETTFKLVDEIPSPIKQYNNTVYATIKCNRVGFENYTPNTEKDKYLVEIFWFIPKLFNDSLSLHEQNNKQYMDILEAFRKEKLCLLYSLIERCSDIKYNVVEQEFGSVSYNRQKEILLQLFIDIYN